MSEPLVVVRATAPATVSASFPRGTRGVNNDGTPDTIPGGTAPQRPNDARTSRVLRLLAAFRALRRVQLEAFLFDGQARNGDSQRVLVNRVLRVLRERGLVQAVVLPGAVTAGAGSRAYALTAAGQRLYAASDASYPVRRLRTPSTVLLEHAVALADIALAFGDAATRTGDTALCWETDWEAVARLGSAVVIPDAFVTLERQGWRTRAFIEVDRATERVAAFERKVERYVELYLRDAWRASFGTWPLILTITTSDAHARSLCRLAERVTCHGGGARIAHSFRFACFDGVRRTGPLAPIWQVAGTADCSAILELTRDEQQAAGASDSQTATAEAWT